MFCAGFGVFTTKAFSKGEFLLDYYGDIIGCDTADSMPDMTFVFHFHIGSQRYW